MTTASWLAIGTVANAQQVQGNVVGSLLPDGVTADLVVSEQYNDNIFSTRNDKISDTISILAPSIGFTHDGDVFDMSLGASAEIGRYNHRSTEDYEDYRLYLDTRLRPMTGMDILAGASYARDHEERNSPDDVNGITPTIYKHTRAYTAWQNRFGSNSLKVGATFDHFDFDDNGPINNDDRDRHMASVGARLDHRLNSTTRLYVEGTWDGRGYIGEMDDSGFDRDSNGVRVAAGVIHKFSPGLLAEIYGGWIYQDYDDIALRDVSTVDYGGRLKWDPTADSRLTLSLGRTVEETTLANASSYVQTKLAANFRQDIDERRSFSLRSRYTDNQYWGVSRRDRIFSIVAEGRHYLSPHLYFGLSYEYENLDSSAISNNYDQSRIMAKLGIDSDKAYTVGSAQNKISGSTPEFDFYLGGKSGLATTGTDLLGPRGNNGTLQADFADHGGIVSVYGGIGTIRNRWYSGFEADMTFSHSDWDHARLPGGRVFGVENDLSYGLSTIFGRTFSKGGMLYGRAGFKVAKFATSYFTSAGTPFPQDDKQLGLRFGTGLQAPISSNLSLRMEYEYTAYSDYDVVIPSGTDNFANTESIISAGIAYHFNSPNLELGAPDSSERSNSLYDGFYTGFQVGVGALVSTATGPRDVGSTLNADFGDVGLSGGIFSGYSTQFSNFVLGAELDAEIGDTGWDHTRDPTGRTYSIDKQYSVGASLLAGLVVGNGTLVYGRAGVVGSDFRYRFKRGNQDIDKHELVTGYRIGVGMEVPVSEKLSIRTDVTYSDYGNTSLLVPGANNGTEKYKSSESLFRLGAIVRF